MKCFFKINVIIILLSACDNIKEQKVFYNNGKIREVVNVDDNQLKQGTLIGYYEDGTLKCKKNYKNDTLEGAVVLFYKNGKVELETCFKKGLQSGTTKKYFENGKLQHVENYVDSVKNGFFLSYYQNAKLKIKNFYQNGRPLLLLKYDTLGKLVFEKHPIIIEVANDFKQNDSIRIKATLFGVYTTKVGLWKKNFLEEHITPCVMKHIKDLTYTYTYPPQKNGVYRLGVFIYDIHEKDKNFFQDTLITVE